MVGDLGTILEDLAPRIMRRDVKADWDVAEVDRIRRERASALEIPVPGLAPHRVAQIARELTAAGSIATVDAGAHMFQTTTYWHSLEPGELLISNGLATMGFALPAAIAAQLVHPDRRVVCFTGDGGLMMVASELETVARLGLPIVIVVFNDAALSLIEVKQEQKGFEGVSMRYAGSRPRDARARLRHPRARRHERGDAARRPDRGADRARAHADRRAHRSVRLPPDAGNRARRAAPAARPVAE